MNSQEIYKTAKSLTEAQIENIVSSWNDNKEEEQIRLFESLVRLGDSKALAVATVIEKKYKKEGSNSIYELAYYS
mgnify:CR=1 FL=1